MSLNPATYAEAKSSYKPLKRTGFKKKADTPSLSRKTSLAKRGKPKRAKRKKLPSMKSLKKRVWYHFSIFIRTKDADAEGYVLCVTCPSPVRLLWNSGEIHAGHWIHNRLDFDERNVHPQCVKCNYHWNTGVNVAYSIYMAKTYGVEVMEELQLLANTLGNRYSRDELNELLIKYRALNAQNPLVKES